MPSRLRLAPVRATKASRNGGFMKIKFVVFLLGLGFLFGSSAQAQERQIIDIGVTYSYARFYPATSGIKNFSMNGGSGSLAVNFKSWLSGVADIGGYSRATPPPFGSRTLSTYLFGPRVSINRHGRVTPFGQVLVGVAHSGSRYLTTGGSQNPFAAAIGGGLDWGFRNHIRIRAAEVDYLLTHFSEVVNNNTRVQNNLRVSTGLIFRF